MGILENHGVNFPIQAILLRAKSLRSLSPSTSFRKSGLSVRDAWEEGGISRFLHSLVYFRSTVFKSLDTIISHFAEILSFLYWHAALRIIHLLGDFLC